VQIVFFISFTSFLETVKKKPSYLKFILRQLGRASACSAPAAFRPLLTKGLVLSGESLLIMSISKKVEFGKQIIIITGDKV